MNIPLGEALVNSSVITRAQLEHALNYIGKKSEEGIRLKLGEALIEKGFASEYEVLKALENQYKAPLISVNDYNISKETAAIISERLARKHNIIPVEKEDGFVTIATSDPSDYLVEEEVFRACGLRVKQVLALSNDILQAIEKYYVSEKTEHAADRINSDYNDVSVDMLSVITEDEISDAPVVGLINSIIFEAVKSGASDIHLEPMEYELRLRLRIDGQLREARRLKMSVHPQVITRIKIMSSMNIAEKRIPQDGRIVMDVDGESVDMRTSTMPTVYGEKAVIRILGMGKDAMYTRSALGFNKNNNELFDKIIKVTNGIILVSGPTGSGKTTTLYTALLELNKVSNNIITVEDPVEYKLDGINQVQVNQKAGLGFSSGLRSILRQDPDIIMIGEIRDTETAQIAMRAAITGHLVLSTIHTNDAASSVARLIDMGLEPYLVASSLAGIIAQRLVRKVCVKCSFEYEADDIEQELLGVRSAVVLKKGKGCPVCDFTGYSGRTAVHEVMPVTKAIRSLITNNAPAEKIRAASILVNTVPLKENAVALVLEGITTTEELMRVTYSID